MTKTRATAPPPEPGYYVVWLLGQVGPTVLWWGAHSDCWRRGAMRVQVTHYLGPLPG